MGIEQHFYTRTGRGYGTVARSAGLTDVFVRKQVLPYCTHPSGAGDTSISWVHLPDGKLLLGQSAKQGHVFFRHDYIVEAHGVDAALRAAAKGVRFETSHDETNGALLPTLDALPLTSTPYKDTTASTVSPLLVQNIIASAQRAVIQGKRIYIPVGGAYSCAAKILAQVLTTIPTPLRHLLGVCTSAGHTFQKKGIHLVFVPATGTKTGDGNILLDFDDKLDIMDDEAFFAARFASLPELKFCADVFVEIDFWLVRAPNIARADGLRNALATRMADILDLHKCNVARAVSWPEVFVRRGLLGRYARYIGFDGAAFVPADILRRAAYDKPNLNDYRLHPTVRKHIEQVLRQIP